MRAIQTFHLAEFLDTSVSLVAAFALGTLIGAERQYRQRTAGLRTNALVALGAAAFIDLGMTLNGDIGATQVAAYIVSGVGFLGAGVIMKEGTNVRGLNTAATLWCSAAVGAFAGSDHLAEAALLTGLVLIGNTALRPLSDMINRSPIGEGQAEETYRVHVTVTDEARDRARDLLADTLDRAGFALRDLHVLEREDGEVEIIATLATTSAAAGELESVTAGLAASPDIGHATWTSSTAE